MLVYEACGIVDLVVNNDIQVFLAVMRGDFRVGELLAVRHDKLFLCLKNRQVDGEQALRGTGVYL